jgi:tetratricopeptide (TPR) repeat protein
MFSSERKILIVLEGILGESSVAEICRKHGIHQTVFYRWNKRRTIGPRQRNTKRSGTDHSRILKQNEIRMNNQMKILVPILILIACHQTKSGPPAQAFAGDSVRFRSLKNVADSLYERDDYFNAVKYFDTLITLAPRNGRFHFKRGYSYDMIYKRPEVKEAISDYLKAIELGYKKSDSYYNLGLSYAYSNDSIAVAYFEKSLAVDPNNVKVIPILARCRENLKRHHLTMNGL